MPLDRVAAFTALAMVSVLAALLAVVGAFLVPVTPVPGVSVGVVVAVVGNYLVTTQGRHATGGTLGAALPAVVWLVVALTLAGARSEGDVVLTSDGSSLAFLLLGAIASAVGITRRPTARTAAGADGPQIGDAGISDDEPAG